MEKLKYICVVLIANDHFYQFPFTKVFYTNEFDLVNEKKKKNAKYQNSGVLQIVKAEVVKEDKIPPEVQRKLDRIKPTDSIR